MEQLLEFLLQIGFLLFLLGIGYGFGHYREVRHLRDIEERIRRSGDIGVTNRKRLLAGSGKVESLGLVTGCTVLATDYFKMFASSLRNLFGGEMKGLVTLVYRARQESLLRMIEEARALGANAVINVRFETVTITDQRRKANGGVEVLAYGTAVRAGGAGET
jgi:uncharacterized protein YbjQ (UPF0145 family)